MAKLNHIRLLWVLIFIHLLFFFVLQSCVQARLKLKSSSCPPRQADSSIYFKLDNIFGGYILNSRVWKANELKNGYVYSDVVPVKNFPFKNFENNLLKNIDDTISSSQLSVAIVLFTKVNIMLSDLIRNTDIMGVGRYFIVNEKMYFELYKFENNNLPYFSKLTKLSSEVDGIVFSDIHTIATKIISIDGDQLTILIPNFVDFDKIIKNSKNELSDKLIIPINNLH